MIERREMVVSQRWSLAAMLVASLLVGALPAAAASDCRGRLEFDELYECEFRSDRAPGTADGFLLFEEFDANAFKATLDVLGERSVGYCTCKTSRQDRFDRAKAFECVTGFGPSVAETFEGSVTGNGDTIYKGQFWSSDPAGGGFARFAFDCSGASEDSDTDSDGEDDSDTDSDGSSDGEDDSGSGDKATVCHKGKKTLEIPASSLQQHLDHGDTLGSCD